MCLTKSIKICFDPFKTTSLWWHNIVMLKKKQSPNYIQYGRSFKKSEPERPHLVRLGNTISNTVSKAAQRQLSGPAGEALRASQGWAPRASRTTNPQTLWLAWPSVLHGAQEERQACTPRSQVLASLNRHLLHFPPCLKPSPHAKEDTWLQIGTSLGRRSSCECVQ